MGWRAVRRDVVKAAKDLLYGDAVIAELMNVSNSRKVNQEAVIERIMINARRNKK